MSSKGGWWNPTLFDEAHTSKVEGGDQPKEWPAGSAGKGSKFSGKGKSTAKGGSKAGAKKPAGAARKP
jgi:hypothetical protein